MDILRTALRYSPEERNGDLPPLYHISFNKNLPNTLTPRQPWGSEEEPTEDDTAKEDDPDAWIFAEFKTPRISFAPSLFHCIQAIYPNTYKLFQSPIGLKKGLEFAVYRYDPQSNARVMTPDDLSNKRAIWDAHTAEEFCFLDPVKIYYCGAVNVKCKADIHGFDIQPFNDPSMKPIKSVVPNTDEITFIRTASIRGGDKFKMRLF